MHNAASRVGLFCRLRWLRNCRQHPDFPFPAFAHVSCSPNARTLNRCPTLVFASETILAHSEGRISSQGLDLIYRYFLVIKSGLERTLVVFFNICLRSRSINEHATICVQRSDACSILLIEAFSLGRTDLLHLLLEIWVSGKRRCGKSDDQDGKYGRLSHDISFPEMSDLKLPASARQRALTKTYHNSTALVKNGPTGAS